MTIDRDNKSAYSLPLCYSGLMLISYTKNILDFVDINTQDLIHVDGTEKYSVKTEVLCINDQDCPEAGMSNHRTRNRPIWASCCRQRTAVNAECAKRLK